MSPERQPCPATHPALCEPCEGREGHPNRHRCQVLINGRMEFVHWGEGAAPVTTLEAARAVRIARLAATGSRVYECRRCGTLDTVPRRHNAIMQIECTGREGEFRDVTPVVVAEQGARP